MRRYFALALTLYVMPAFAQTRPRDSNLQIGDPAPDFQLYDLAGKNQIKLSAHRGKPVVLVFGSYT